MKPLKFTLMFLILIFGFLNCQNKKDDTTQKNLIFLALASANANSISAQFPNVVEGSPEAIKGATSVGTATSDAISSATGSAGLLTGSTGGGGGPSSNILSFEKNLLISKALNSVRATPCNGTEQTINFTYTTEFTVTASPLSNLLSGSYTVKPNLKYEGKSRCNQGPPSTSSFEYNTTGSVEVTFNNATIKFLDIEKFVKEGQFVYSQVTLNGTVSETNINDTFGLTTENSSSNNTFISKTKSSSSRSSKTTSNNLQIDGGSPASLEITNRARGNFDSELKSSFSGNSSSSCFSKFFSEGGTSHEGTYNGGKVKVSYNTDTEKTKQLWQAIGVPVVMCN